MVTESKKLILWTGPKHSGKTSRVAELVNAARKEGFIVAGILAPSLYENDKLIGFDIIDLQNQNRKQLLRRNSTKVQSFFIMSEGQELGLNALNGKNTEQADIVIIDEFGPLEISGNLWREAVDSLVQSGKLILLVVRNELVWKVRQICSGFPCRVLAAFEPESIEKVLDVLRNKHSLSLVSG